jgi:drug/metabolite transporter (DMT)-like permease
VARAAEVDVMRRMSGYVDGLLSGATWGAVAVVLPVAYPLSGASLPATSVAVAALFDTAAALFLVIRAGVAGAFADVLRLLVSKRALSVGVCSLLGGPLFMGGYVAAIILAGPSDALTATATYPVIGAVLARLILHQRLDRVGWLGVIVAVLGAALIACDAGGSAGGGRLLGLALALVAAAAVACEGIVATRVMVGLETNTVMAVRELLSAAMFGIAVLVLPGGFAAVGQVAGESGLLVPTVVAGVVGGYSYAVWYRSIRKIGVARAMALNISYAMWGLLLAWALQRADVTLLALNGCLIVTAGATLTIMSGRLRERTPHRSSGSTQRPSPEPV